jgi:hypothetical protein
MINCKKDIFNKTVQQPTAHTTRETLGLLHEFLDDGIVNFPPRSPDLTILDYFVFPYLKNNVFKKRAGTIPELMQAITDTCNLIDVPTLQRSFENMKRRVTLCLEAEGRHFGNLL